MFGKTYSAKPADIEKKWLLIDASGLVVGRLATIIDVLQRLLKPREIVLRNDLDWQRDNVPRPAAYLALRTDPDLELVAAFGEVAPPVTKILVTHHPFLPPADAPGTHLLGRAHLALPVLEAMLPAAALAAPTMLLTSSCRSIDAIEFTCTGW